MIKKETPMMSEKKIRAYKAVAKDRTSWYDRATKWRKGSIVRVENPDPKHIGPCGKGIHCSPSLLGAVFYQHGPSLYAEVEPLDILAQDKTKMRCTGVKVLRWLDQEEVDSLAGFKLWEANNPHHPLEHRPVAPLSIEEAVHRLRQWASVRTSVGDGDSVRDSVWSSVRDSVRVNVWDSVGASVGGSVWDSVWRSVGASVGDSAWRSVGDRVVDSVADSVGAYTGGLFPGITSWKYAQGLGSDPWRPLLDLWYAGYVPSFDGTTERLHRGKAAKVVWESRRRRKHEYE